MSTLDGGLSFRAIGQTTWSPALINYPVASGEAFKTAPNAKAEIEIGPDRIALAGDTELDIAKLDRSGVALTLAHGRIGLRLHQLAPGEIVSVKLAQGGARFAEAGAYDIAAGDTKTPARLAVFAGSAHFTGGEANLVVRLGETAVLSGVGRVTAKMVPAADDAFAQWWRSHGQVSARVVPAGVSAAMTGVEALAKSGQWAVAPKIGEIWYPQHVPADWMPYRYGHWAWIEPWGWTWIDDQAWGFAPFHYGRWMLIGAHWGWVPGRKVAHPAYAPALVAFLGTPGVGISFAGGNGPAIGWFPLAPGEIYWPSYTKDLAYVRRINRPDVENARTIRTGGNGRLPVEIVNWHFAYRIYATVVPRPVFVSGKPVAVALVTLPRERLLNAPTVMGSPDVTPGMLAALAAPPPRLVERRPAIRRLVIARRIVRKPEERPPIRRVAVRRIVRKPVEKPVRRVALAKRDIRRAELARPVLHRPAVRLGALAERSSTIHHAVYRGRPQEAHLRVALAANRRPRAHPTPRRLAKTIERLRIPHRPLDKRRL